eukprot:TRINITY_DN5752_c0_g1_i1.p1 TRINITY_DN5752_c0_g1~~TRINITY_DN5752_c0_g1_i1.p1  ORF type:complete len:491 (-),score=106.23 TRINITY_DN5752_c0_g1_i1:305-1777(-)
MVQFYSSYILTSLDPRYTNHTYIGFTNHPKRRIRQHNGLLKNGARRTQHKRPWEMVLLVHGFTSKKQALHFEAVWQKPQGCLQMREVLKRLPFKWSYSLGVKIRFLFEMLQLSPWKNLPLTVQWLNDKYWNGNEKPTKWKRSITRDCPAPPPHIKMMIAPLESLDVYNKDSDESESEGEDNSDSLNDSFDPDVSSSSQTMPTQSLEPCPICDERIFSNQKTACCPHIDCSSKTHLQCLSRWFLKDSPSLLPTFGFCPVCSSPHSWSDAVIKKTPSKPKNKNISNTNMPTLSTPSHTQPKITPFLSSNKTAAIPSLHFSSVHTTATPTKQSVNYSNNHTPNFSSPLYSQKPFSFTLTPTKPIVSNNNMLRSPTFTTAQTTQTTPTTPTTKSSLNSTLSPKSSKKRQPLSPLSIDNHNHSNFNICIENTPPQKRTKSHLPQQPNATPPKIPNFSSPSFSDETTTTNNSTPKTKSAIVKNVENCDIILIENEL